MEKKGHELAGIAALPFQQLYHTLNEGSHPSALVKSGQNVIRAHQKTGWVSKMMMSLSNVHMTKAANTRNVADAGVLHQQAVLQGQNENLAFIQRAREALRRSSMDAVPDIFDINPEDQSSRLSRYGGIPEEIFKTLWFDSVFTIFGEAYEVRVTSVRMKPGTMINARGRRRRTQIPNVRFKINQTAQEAASNAMLVLQGKPTVPKKYADNLDDAEAEYFERSTDFYVGSEDALEEERIFVSKRVRLLNMFGTSMVKQAIRVNAFFDLDLRGEKPWKIALKTVQSAPGGNVVIAGLNDAQMRLKHMMAESLSSNTEELKRIPVPHYDRFKAGQSVLLNEFLKEYRFRGSRADNLNILAVGLPIGMIKDLQIGVIDNKTRADSFDPYKRNSLLRLKVWKRDHQFDDLVFKPQTFTFDHTRFLSPVDSFTDVKIGDEFKDIIGSKIKFMDYDEEGRIYPEGQEYADVRQSDDLKLVRSRARYYVIRNTLYSEGLKYYIRLLTGINLDEQEFYLDPRLAAAREQVLSNKKTRRLVSKIMQIYLTQEGIETEAQLKEHQALIDQLTSFTHTTIFQAKSNAISVLQPTLFDRIFCIGVDPDNFQIDKRKTMSTKAGRRALRSALRRKNIIRKRGNYFLRPRRKSEGKVAIFEYFVTADMILGNKSIYKKRLNAEKRAARADRKQTPFDKFQDHSSEIWSQTASGWTHGTNHGPKIGDDK
jgi:hypothetical protein